METGAIHPLKQWRLDRGWTLDACAAGVGTVRQMWFGWEKELSIPGNDYLTKLYVFTRGEITPDTMHFPWGYPDLETGFLPLDEQGDTPLFDRLVA